MDSGLALRAPRNDKRENVRLIADATNYPNKNPPSTVTTLPVM
jgi:hypothetical protein